MVFHTSYCTLHTFTLHTFTLDAPDAIDALHTFTLDAPDALDTHDAPDAIDTHDAIDALDVIDAHEQLQALQDRMASMTNMQDQLLKTLQASNPRYTLLE